MGVLEGYSRDTQGVRNRRTHARISDLHPCRSLSVAEYKRRCYHMYGLRAARPPTRARVCVWRHRPGSRVLAAGVTWTCRTAKAGWAGRWGHTSVVDAAGAIYVIGGFGPLQDVWVSTDGGARPDSVNGGGRWGTMGVLRGTKGVV
jgi:hypothetical protein